MHLGVRVNMAWLFHVGHLASLDINSVAITNLHWYSECAKTVSLSYELNQFQYL